MVTYVENFEASNIKHSNKRSTFLTSFQSLVTHGDQVPKETIIQTLGQGADGVGTLVYVHALRYELVADLNLGLGNVFVEVHAVHSHQRTECLTHLEEEYFASLFSIYSKILCVAV